MVNEASYNDIRKALKIDYGLCAIITLIMFLMFDKIVGISKFFGIEGSDSWFGLAYIFFYIFVLPLFFVVLTYIIHTIYFIVCPLVKKGRTIGLKIKGIKIIKENGDNVNLVALLKRQVFGNIVILNLIVILLLSLIFKPIALIISEEVFQQIIGFLVIGVSVALFVFREIYIRKNGKTLSDGIAKTKFIYTNN